MRVLICKKLSIAIISLLFLSVFQVFSQAGCTDSLANNYDPGAVENDGSCLYEEVIISPTNSYPLDDALSGTSGLIYWNDYLWTHNDSSDTNLYQLNPANGSIVNSISLAPQVNHDWEEIAQDEDYIYVGDFGNNVSGDRTDLKIIRVSKSSIIEGNPQMDEINFTYQDQTDFTPKDPNNTDYDCEAFVISADAIFLFTKEWLSNETRLYKLPKTPGTYEAELQDGYDVNGLITGSTYHKDNDVIVLSGYSNLMQPFVYLLYDFTDEEFFGGNKRKINIELPFHQVEGIATNDGLQYWMTNESLDFAGINQQLHTLDLTDFLDNYLHINSVEALPEVKIYPNPTSSILQIVSEENIFPLKYVILNLKGKIIKEGILDNGNSILDVSKLSAGTYMLNFGQEMKTEFKFIKK
ncbi:MAG TPA: T9SS type A sorting domain-containing protein [Flavobacteriaceae bacterium]|nr:T9SS type A sorting domain-containing protein [Flavobacteriaceae bacterium]